MPARLSPRPPLLLPYPGRPRKAPRPAHGRDSPPPRVEAFSPMNAIVAAPRPPASMARRILVAVALACIVVAPVFHLRLVLHMDPGQWTDLYSPWFGTQAALHGADPYSPAVTATIQRTIY